MVGPAHPPLNPRPKLIRGYVAQLVEVVQINPFGDQAGSHVPHVVFEHVPAFIVSLLKLLPAMERVCSVGETLGLADAWSARLACWNAMLAVICCFKQLLRCETVTFAD